MKATIVAVVVLVVEVEELLDVVVVVGLTKAEVVVKVIEARTRVDPVVDTVNILHDAVEAVNILDVLVRTTITKTNPPPLQPLLPLLLLIPPILQVETTIIMTTLIPATIITQTIRMVMKMA